MSDGASLGLGCARRCVHTVLPLLVLFAGSLPTADASWKITTYLHPTGNPPIFSMREAELYLAGVKPQRFAGMSTVPLVDLSESSSAQFPTSPFPGLDMVPGPTNTDNFAGRVTGTLTVNTVGQYDFRLLSGNSGSQLRLDINQDDGFEAAELIWPGVGLRSEVLNLAAGNYPFEITYFNQRNTASLRAAYRAIADGQSYTFGDASGGIALAADATVTTLGADVTNPDYYQELIKNFSQADALRTSTNEPGFPFTGSREVFNVTNTFPIFTTLAPLESVPGLDFSGDENNFLVVGRGLLVVPAGGISDAVFRSTTDDGGRLLIDTNQDGDLLDSGDVIILDDALSSIHDEDSLPVSLAEGTYLMEYSFFEGVGSSVGVASVNLGGRGGFTLLGDDAAVAAGTGLDVVPEPTSVALAVLAFLGIVPVRRTFGKRR